MSKDFKGTAFKNGLEVGDKYAKTGIAYIQALKYYAVALSPVAVVLNTTTEQTFTVAGLEVGDTVLSINKPTSQAGLGIVNYRVSAKDTLAITFSNNTGVSITPTGAEIYKVVIATI
jgi:ribosomal protein L2